MRIHTLVAMALIVGSPTMAKDYICQSAVESQLTKYRIPADRIEMSSPARRVLGGNEGVRVGYKYWLTIKNCTAGYLIIDTDLDCNVGQIFTSGPCKLSGVPDC
jgi:hypothetical protein